MSEAASVVDVSIHIGVGNADPVEVGSFELPLQWTTEVSDTRVPTVSIDETELSAKIGAIFAAIQEAVTPTETPDTPVDVDPLDTPVDVPPLG